MTLSECVVWCGSNETVLIRVNTCARCIVSKNVFLEQSVGHWIRLEADVLFHSSNSCCCVCILTLLVNHFVSHLFFTNTLFSNDWTESFLNFHFSNYLCFWFFFLFVAKSESSKFANEYALKFCTRIISKSEVVNFGVNLWKLKTHTTNSTYESQRWPATQFQLLLKLFIHSFVSFSVRVLVSFSIELH